MTGLKRKIIVFFALFVLMCMAFANAYGISIEENNKEQYDVKIKRHATETSDGVRVYISKKTGKVVFVEKIPMTGHRWGRWEIIKKPTYSEDGYKIRRCLKHPYLKHADKRILLRTGPKWGKWIVDRKPTKTREGLKHRIDELHKWRIEYRIIPRIKSFPEANDNSFSPGRITFNPNTVNNPGSNQNLRNAMGGSTSGDSSSKGSPDGGASVSGGQSSDGIDSDKGSAHIPFGAADAAIAFANGAVAVFWWILLLPLVKVMLWIGKKRKEAEENNL